MAVKLIADVHSAIGGIGDQAGPEDTLLVLGDVLGLIDWADFTGILPEVLGPDRLRDMLFKAFAAGADAARNLKNVLLSPENEYYESLRDRVESDYREFRRAVEEAGCRTLVLFGNSDIPDTMRDVFNGSSGVEMAEGTRELEGQVFGFLPGSVSSPFDMPGESDDEYLRGRLAELGKVDVLCAHIPPALPELSQLHVVRHFDRLSQETLGVDLNIDVTSSFITRTTGCFVSTRSRMCPKNSDEASRQSSTSWRSRPKRVASAMSSSTRCRPSSALSAACLSRPTSLKMLPHLWRSCASSRSLRAWMAASLACAMMLCGSVLPPTRIATSVSRVSGRAPRRCAASV